jgi:MYXO-CTERM domain-containing protein
MRVGAVLLTAMAISAGACVDAELGDSRHQIRGGDPAPNDGATVALVHRQFGFFFCSGTLVSPRIVVTAAHCLPPNLEPGFQIDDLTDVAIYFGEVVDGTGVTIDVLDGKVNPLWTEDTTPNDIALLSLAIDAPANITPIPMNTELIGDIGLVGSTVRAVGYGLSFLGLDDGGTRRQGTLTVESGDATNIFSTPDPATICPGDSGGSLFATVGGSERLVGVASRGDCDSSSIHERVDAHYTAFIEPFITGCDADGECGDNCLAPDPDCPCVADGFCAADCADLASDPDCSATCTETDGVCGAECEFADLDCFCVADNVCQAACGDVDPDCDSGGCGCQSGPGSPLGLGGMLLLVLVAFGRRKGFASNNL